jgi:cysteine synthase
MVLSIQVLDVSLIDEVITVTDEDPISATRLLAKEKGLLAWIPTLVF